MKTKTKKERERRTLTISHSSSETMTASPLDDDSSDADIVEGGGTGKEEEEEEEALCCTPVTRTPSTMRTGKDMLGTRAKSTRDEEDNTIFLWGKILLCSTTGQSFGKIVRRRRALSSSCIVFFRVHQKRRQRRRRVLRRVLHRILLVDHFSSPPSSGCTRPSSRIYSRSFRQYAETRNIRTKLDSISLRSRTAGTNQ